jgi:16S rRNA (adenine1518-N6/adenine1519-N6)-dimethyltransferase
VNLRAHTPRKRFGQHFLHEHGVIERMLRALDPRPGDTMIEIGPGEGALTHDLLARCGALTAIELDRDLAARLRIELGARPGFRLIEADVLTVDFAALGSALRIVGNLPYNISTPILFHLLESAASIRDMHFMLQREVVERMAAVPGSKVYGRLSVMLQARCRVESLFEVGPGAFRPPPKVDSAVVRLTPLTEPALDAAGSARLAHCVRAAFGQRRKTLRNALAGLATPDALSAVGIDPAARAENVPVSAWIALAEHLPAI